MNIVELATQAGLQLLLDGRIGSQTYQSVSGSLGALQRFADAVSAATRAEACELVHASGHAKHNTRRNTPARARRIHRRPLHCRGSVTGRPAVSKQPHPSV